MDNNVIPKPNHKFYQLTAREAFHVIHQVAKAEGEKRGTDMHWPTFKYWNACYMDHRRITHSDTKKKKRGRPRLSVASADQYSLGV